MMRKKSNPCPGYFSYPPCYGVGCVRPKGHVGRCAFKVPLAVKVAIELYPINSSEYVRHIANSEPTERWLYTSAGM